ncbi:uncharacterized protein LOC141588612 [Silene latifolia]|uniref:uncharacterized protein LOC141588612 n=1 Tax=Silene latifolia TaxID=37657 RepID=UPI003D7809B8
MVEIQTTAVAPTIMLLMDRDTRVAIGMGDRLDRLYYLRKEPQASTSTVAVSTSFSLWHHRLGHPSEQVVKLLPFFRNNKYSLSKPCEVCHRAKHIRSSFPLSSNNSLCAFELIHCDLWGPFDTPSSSGARYFLTLRVFGCLCFAHNQRAKGDKFASRSRKCAFIGYPSRKKGWYLYDLERQEFFVSRDVHFYEDKFPFLDALSTISPSILDAQAIDDLVIDWEYPTKVSTEAGSSFVATVMPSDTPSDPSATAPEIATVDDVVVPAELGRGHLVKFPSSNLRDYVVDITGKGSSSSSASSLTVSKSLSSTPYPLTNYFSSHKFLPHYRTYLAALTSHTEPRNFNEAVKDEGWRKAMEAEMQALIDNDLGDLKYFLGIEVARNYYGLFLCQRKYVLDVLEEVGLLGCKPAPTPLEQHHQLGSSMSKLLPDAAPYRRLVGRLVYLAVTRLDLSYAVHILSRFMSAPRQDYWNTALRTNPVFHERTKHIEMDCHFVRDAIQKGIVTPSHVPTKVQLADVLLRLSVLPNLFLWSASWIHLHINGVRFPFLSPHDMSQKRAVLVAASSVLSWITPSQVLYAQARLLTLLPGPFYSSMCYALRPLSEPEFCLFLSHLL